MINIKDKSEFQKEVMEHKDGPVIVDFYADWCGPCKMMEPVLAKLDTEHKEIKIVKVNVDQFQDLSMEYNVMSIPTTFVFKNGQPVKQMIGFQSEQALLSAAK